MTEYPRVLFRLESSLEVGRGHLSRCLTLAEELRRRGTSSGFSREGLSAESVAEVEGRGFGFVGLRPDAAKRLLPAWLVVDSYGIDAGWEAWARPCARRMFVIDDLANRQHECDLLLDQNLGASRERYEALVPFGAELLLGPSFALLGSDFDRDRVAHSVDRERPVRRILVSLGGGAVSQPTALVVGALSDLELGDARVEVILSETAPGRAELARYLSARPQFSIVGIVDNMATRMSDADLFIGSGGTSLWERCSLGLPSVTVAVAENQVRSSMASHDAGATMYAGRVAELDKDRLSPIIATLLEDRHLRSRMSAQARQIVGDARGASRVVDRLLSIERAGHALRPLVRADSDLLLRWRNSQRVRSVMRNTSVIAQDEHDSWVQARLSDAQARTLIYEADVPLGCVSFVMSSPGVAEWGFYIGEENAPPRSGLRMGWLGLEYAFGEMGLDWVSAEVMHGNQPSLAYHRKLGFVTASEGAESTKLSLPRDAWEATRGPIAETFGLER